MINLHEPSLSKKDFQNIKICFDSGWISTSGNFIKIFEKKIKKATKSKNVVSVVNGTSALQVGLLACGVKSNDEVIVPTITFVSSVNSIIYNNASPIFMDVDDYFNIDQKKTIEFINKKTIFKKGSCYNKMTGKKISAIIIVHVFGNAAKFETLYKLCKKRNIKIIEDAAESLGTIYTSGPFKGKHTGTIGDVGCISFNGNKIVTSGGGGAILTKSKKIAKEILHLVTQAKSDPLNFVHDKVGYNFRISNLHASVGSSQLDKLQIFIKKKKIIYKSYIKEFSKNNGFKILQVPGYAKNNYWLNILEIRDKNKNKIMKKLIKKSVNVRSVWYPNHLQKPFRKFFSYKIENATKKVKSCICLPSSSHLKKTEIKKIYNIINK